MGGSSAAAIIILLFGAVSSTASASPPKWASSIGSSSFGDRIRRRLHNPAVGPEDPLLPPLGLRAPALCLECELLIGALKAEIDLGMTYDQVVKEATWVCLNVVGYSQNTCDGYISLFAPMLYYMFTNGTIIPSEVCGMTLNAYGCNTTRPEREWTIEIHGDKPPVEPLVLPESGEPTIKVLQISDMHMDPLYSPGSNADCVEQLLCCREESGVPVGPEAEAWFWGDYRYCGSPRWMLEDMLANIRAEHPDISYVLWTGDVVPHNMWSATREWNKRIIRETYEMLEAYFPDIPIFPVIGNHEHSPIDQFPDPDNAPPEFAADWMYEALATQWAKLLPDLDISTVLYGGFYSVPVKPGFRIISVNSMFGYTGDFWLFMNSHDVGHELQWLEAELGKAESEGELVHLLGHIPPGLIYTERTWSREYNRIVKRYENIIRGQFFGHTHYDEFEVFHDGDRPMGVAYIAPSQTPYYFLNPAYRIYTIDGERPETTWMVLDHDTFIMNLTEAHETNVSRWYRLYSAKETYGMPSLTPDDWHELGQRMAEDRALFDVYWSNFVSAGDPFLLQGCDDVCYEQRLCDVMTADRNNLDACYGVLQRKKAADSKITRMIGNE
ncbi:sphingomyelin phosphodiesterase-like [Macrobrachium nipponense]|uniref:sphingomyelin phosphodiesterase-like n=1 Tax=Macrobrachium nipponense TaxID=159736 RepID=UPI0030C8CFA1